MARRHILIGFVLGMTLGMGLGFVAARMTVEPDPHSPLDARSPVGETAPPERKATIHQISRAWSELEADSVALSIDNSESRHALENSIGVSTELLAALDKNRERSRQIADRRIELEKQILEVGGLVRVNNVWWLNGRLLKPGEGLQLRDVGATEWRPCSVGQYGNKARLLDGTEVRLEDIEREGGHLRRPVTR